MASNYTHGALDSNLSVSTNTIHIYGIVIGNRNSAVADVQITEADGSTVIMELAIPGDSTFETNLPFLADGGFIIQTVATIGSDVFATVFHSNALGAA
jgi:hypothetical protein